MKLKTFYTSGIVITVILITFSSCDKHEESPPIDPQYCVRLENRFVYRDFTDFANYDHEIDPSNGSAKLLQINNLIDLNGYEYALKFEYDKLNRLSTIWRQERPLRQFFYRGNTDKIDSVVSIYWVSYCQYNEDGLLIKKFQTNMDSSTRTTTYYYNDRSAQPHKIIVLWQYPSFQHDIWEYHFEYDGLNHPFKNSTVQFGNYTHCLSFDITYPIHINENITRSVIYFNGVHFKTIEYDYVYDENNYASICEGGNPAHGFFYEK